MGFESRTGRVPVPWNVFRSSLSSSTFHLQLPMFFPGNNREWIGKRARAASRAEPNEAPKELGSIGNSKFFLGCSQVGTNRA